ncbi:hypothetical protein SAMN05443661_10894 [Natronobacterium gregoryi]|nr:hypothetical protein Natgr_0476 [Natronobacterium gregoryi SP2]PLK18341.1 hypothetical protein CYV19_18125 [Natronobacterium gregoryi SP2]SFI89127.1 hypothetical protein SAMN05443661_10894 [Natronobacterium gregoryi]
MIAFAIVDSAYRGLESPARPIPIRLVIVLLVVVTRLVRGTFGMEGYPNRELLDLVVGTGLVPGTVAVE